MKIVVKSFLIALVFSLSFQTCSGGGNKGIFNQPITLAIDSANNRLFVIESLRHLIILKASDRSNIGSQPIVNKDRLPAIYDLLPETPLHMASFTDGAVSKIFIAGALATDDGERVLNRLLVLDFDGTTLSENVDSPLILSDGNNATDDTDNVPGDLLVDQDNARLFVTDATAGFLYVLSAEDGSQVNAPIVIAGTPNKMSLAGDFLFVANASTVAGERVVTIVDTTDFSTSTIDLGVPLTDISVVANSGRYVLLGQDGTTNRVLIRSVSADLATVTSIASATAAAADGELSASLGLTGSVGGVFVTSDTSGNVFGYAPQADGNVELLDFSTDLSTFTASSLPTVTEVIRNPVAYTSAGAGVIVYMPAQASGDLVYTSVGSSEIGARF